MVDVKKQHILEAIAQKARNVAPKGADIILYGSQARGDAHEGSDWDILVLLDKDRISLDDIDDVSYPLRELGWEIGEDINTVLYTKADWRNYSYTPFYKNVEAEGIAL